MSAALVNLAIEQGATFTKAILWKDSSGSAISLSGYNVSMQIRENVDDATPIASGDSTGGTETIGIVLEAGAVTGLINLTITSANTKNMKFTRASYDLIANNGSDVITRLMEGTVMLNKRVTR